MGSCGCCNCIKVLFQKLFPSPLKSPGFEEEVMRSSGSAGTSSGRWWDAEIDMFWNLKDRMQRMDDLGVELSQLLVEFMFLLYGNGDGLMLKEFNLFVWSFWSPATNGDRLITRKVISLIRTANGFITGLQKQNKTVKDKDSRQLTLEKREFRQLIDEINTGLRCVERIMVFLQMSMRTRREDCLKLLDCSIELCKKSVEELKMKIERLKKNSPFFSAFRSEIDEFWNGDMDLEMSQLWNTSWELEDEYVGGDEHIRALHLRVGRKISIDDLQTSTNAESQPPSFVQYLINI